jgi:hypothetical protein
MSFIYLPDGCNIQCPVIYSLTSVNIFKTIIIHSMSRFYVQYFNFTYSILRFMFSTSSICVQYFDLCYNNNNNNGSSYIAHFTNVPMRFTISGGLFRTAYYGAIGSQAAYNHER